MALENAKINSEDFPQIVGNSLHWFLKLTRCSGLCPLRYIESPTRKFMFRYNSLTTALSFIGTIWLAFIWIVYFLEFSLRKGMFLSDGFRKFMGKLIHELENIPDSTTSFKMSTIYAINIGWGIISLSMLYNIMISWVCIPRLLRYLNGWYQFDKEFEICFSNFRSVINSRLKVIRAAATKRLELFTAVYVIIPTIVGLIWVGCSLYKLRSALTIFDGIFSFGIFIHSITLEMIDDCKNILLYSCVTKAFKQVQVAVDIAVTKKKLTGSQVEGWKNLVLIIRRQCHLLGRQQAPSQLYFIAEGIAILTASMYLILNLPWDMDGVASGAYIWICIPLVLLIRVFTKSHIAEQMTAEEQELGLILATIDPIITESTLPQIQDLHDLVTRKQTKIVLGNVINYDKKLLLTILNQVVTYLIALTQFVDS